MQTCSIALADVHGQQMSTKYNASIKSQQHAAFLSFESHPRPHLFMLCKGNCIAVAIIPDSCQRREPQQTCLQLQQPIWGAQLTAGHCPELPAQKPSTRRLLM